MSQPAMNKPRPEINPVMQPYWQGLCRGELVLQTCLDCDAVRFPAAALCPRCHGMHSAWRRFDDGATLVSFATFHKAYWPSFAQDIPYSVIQVRLDAGVQVYSNWYGQPPALPTIGMRLRARYEPLSEDVYLLKFEPAR
ncbi:MAG: Zn-ribbon domain-containing OB-fold protein [Hylemonella sp.]